MKEYCDRECELLSAAEARIAALESERAEVLRWANEFSARFGQYTDVEEALNELRALAGKENY